MYCLIHMTGNCVGNSLCLEGFRSLVLKMREGEFLPLLPNGILTFLPNVSLGVMMSKLHHSSLCMQSHAQSLNGLAMLPNWWNPIANVILVDIRRKCIISGHTLPHSQGSRQRGRNFLKFFSFGKILSYHFCLKIIKSVFWTK